VSLKAALSVMSLGLLLLPALSEAQEADGPVGQPVVQETFAGVQAALRGRPKAALKAFRRVKGAHDNGQAVGRLIGLSHLLSGDRRRALKLIPKTGPWAVYRAMAELGSSGGKARARGIIAKAAQAAHASPGVLFMAALAFAQARQPEVANRYLSLAAKRTKHALSEDWAPDPAVGLAKAALKVLEGQMDPARARLRLAELLHEAGRRGAALHWAQQAEAGGAPLARILRLRARVMADVSPEHAVDAVQAWLQEEPEAAEARILSAEYELQGAHYERAEQALEKVKAKTAPLRARLNRARCRIALEKGQNKAALRFARAATRAAPKSIRSRAALARALIANNEAGRAKAIVESLTLEKNPPINVFALLAEVREKTGRTAKLGTLKLRAQGFEASLQAPRTLIFAIEHVFEAVRDGEAGLGRSTLPALRSKDPRLSLPMDISLARAPRPGVARQARDRILAACSARWVRLLSADGGWDRAMTASVQDGRKVPVDMHLSAADPFRCRGGSLRLGGTRR